MSSEPVAPFSPVSSNSLLSIGLSSPPPLNEVGMCEPAVYPENGLLTFEAEGSASRESIYYSRVLHHPTSGSGVTIGRGYDMLNRSRTEIASDLIKSGISKADALQLAQAAGLSGEAADRFIANSSFSELTVTQELKLFEISYAAAEADVFRITQKDDVTKAYGKTDWGALDDTIKQVLVDLRFRGDYTPAARREIQSAVAANDLSEFSQLISNRRLWSDVPEDRFKRRSDFVMSVDFL